MIPVQPLCRQSCRRFEVFQAARPGSDFSVMSAKLNFAFWTLPRMRDTLAMGKNAERMSGTRASRTMGSPQILSWLHWCDTLQHRLAMNPTQKQSLPHHTHPLCSSSNSKQPGYSLVSTQLLALPVSGDGSISSEGLQIPLYNELSLFRNCFANYELFQPNANENIITMKLLAFPVFSEESHPSSHYPVPSPNTSWSQIFKGFRTW